MNSVKKIIAFFLFVIALNGYSQQVRLDAVLDTTKIRIGEQAKVDIYVTYSSKEKDIKIQWPSIGDTITGKIEVIAVSPIDTTLPDKTNSTKIFQHQQIIVSVYDSGFYAMPGFEFIINDDTAHPIYTNPLFLEVHTVPTDTSATKLKDIKPPFGEEFNWKWYLNYVYFGAGILVLIIIVILVTLYYARKNKQVNLEPEKPKIPPHLTALASLEKIKRDLVWKDGKVKEYYSSISETIRTYIEDRYNVNALESTTDEIMMAFRSQVIDRDSKDKLQQLLMLSDLVKFAKMFPIDDEHNFTLQNAFDFVNGTKREEEMHEGAEILLDNIEATNENTVENNNEKLSAQKETGAVQANPYVPGYVSEPKQNEVYLDEKTKIPEETSSGKKKNKTVIIVVLSSLFTIGLIFTVNKLFFSSTSDNPLEALVSNINRICPVMLDTENRLNKVTLIEEKTVQFDLALVNISSDQFDPNMLKARIEPMVVKEAKTNAQMEEFRTNQAVLKYNYSDKNGNFLFTIEVKPDDYNTYY
ncbi:hypothetical protein [Aurantibacillus circumpalustris]|uniref:hypothetical protein n=1 Tax=Aurantibacillus circumpalustris TaxID=3036359 RepID=UPI00295B6A1C|nr:hypothetical protein [Aurantibacillus circumpalustris]